MRGSNLGAPAFEHRSAFGEESGDQAVLKWRRCVMFSKNAIHMLNIFSSTENCFSYESSYQTKSWIDH